jgi:hypothetical protein
VVQIYGRSSARCQASKARHEKMSFNGHNSAGACLWTNFDSQQSANPFHVVLLGTTTSTIVGVFHSCLLLRKHYRTRSLLERPSKPKSKNHFKKQKKSIPISSLIARIMMNMQGSMMHPSLTPQQQQGSLNNNNMMQQMYHRSRPEDAAVHITVCLKMK